MCELAGVSRASFYRDWEKREPTAAEMALRDAMQRASATRPYYGYRRITAHLQRQGFVVGAKKVRRLMREDNLLAIRRRRFVVTTESDHAFRVHPNLAPHLELTDINQLWVADLTYVRLEQEFVYVAVVLDAYSRRVIGWALGRKLESCLAGEALEKAIASREPKPGLVHHSDRGSQYACGDYIHRLESCGAVLSMSRPGRPWEEVRELPWDAEARRTRRSALSKSRRAERPRDGVHRAGLQSSAAAFRAGLPFADRVRESDYACTGMEARNFEFFKA